MQGKLDSIIEILVNKFLGLCVTWVMLTFMIGPAYGFTTNGGDNLIIILILGSVSVVKNYIVRRWFNKKLIGIIKKNI
jgi:hypothetical protein